VDGAFAILGLARAEGQITEQITLPLRHGGLGLSRTNPTNVGVVYLAAVAATQRLMLTGPEAFQPLAGPIGGLLRPQWEALHDRAGSLWPPELHEVSPDSLDHIAQAQGTFARHPAQVCFDALLATFIEAGRRDRARLLSCACRPASAWLNMLPLLHLLELKSREVQTGLRQRLGLSALPLNASAVLCGCRAALRGSDADHGMRCPALAAQVKLRHNMLKGILRRAVHRADLPLPSSHPSAASLVSPPVLAPPWTAPQPVLRHAGTFLWSSPRTHPWQTSPCCTLSPSTPFLRRRQQREQRRQPGASRNGAHMLEWS
jgi:hypothetical protein